LASELSDYYEHSKRFQAQMVCDMRFDGTALTGIDRRIGEIVDLAQRTSQSVMRVLSADLATPWFLMNTFNDTYPFNDSVVRRCPYCHGKMLRQIGRNAMHGEQRAIDVCPRCGTVLDIQHGSSLSDIFIDTPGEVLAGESFAGSVRVILGEVRAKEGNILVATKIFVPGLPGVSPWRQIDSQGLSDGVLEFPFKFDLPRFGSRQCNVKVLVTTWEGIAFGQRPLIVHEAAEAI
jgi:hypothetical protein